MLWSVTVDSLVLLLASLVICAHVQCDITDFNIEVSLNVICISCGRRQAKVSMRGGVVVQEVYVGFMVVKSAPSSPARIMVRSRIALVRR